MLSNVYFEMLGFSNNQEAICMKETSLIIG